MDGPSRSSMKPTIEGDLPVPRSRRRGQMCLYFSRVMAVGTLLTKADVVRDSRVTLLSPAVTDGPGGISHHTRRNIVDRVTCPVRRRGAHLPCILLLFLVSDKRSRKSLGWLSRQVCPTNRALAS